MRYGINLSTILQDNGGQDTKGHKRDWSYCERLAKKRSWWVSS